MEYNIDLIMNNTLGEDDTFEFNCKGCGECCQNRDSGIILTGYDIFRLRQALQIEAADLLKNYTEYYIGNTSKLPVCILRENKQGQCMFLEKGKCKVHACKPLVCAIYPLGRMISQEENKYTYFLQHVECNGTLNNKKVYTLNQWLDEFNIKDTDEIGIYWAKAISAISSVLRDIDNESLIGPLVNVIGFEFYANYDIEKDYLPQLKNNIENINKIFKSLGLQS